MQLVPYLSFKGDCEAAFQFYLDLFKGKPGEMFRYAGTPIAGEVPGEWGDKIMHGSITIEGQQLMGADMGPRHYQQPAGFSISLHLKDTGQAERIFKGLSEGGKVTFPLEKTFWAERFGMVTDRFGIPWSINCEA